MLGIFREAHFYLYQPFSSLLFYSLVYTNALLSLLLFDVPWVRCYNFLITIVSNLGVICRYYIHICNYVI